MTTILATLVIVLLVGLAQIAKKVQMTVRLRRVRTVEIVPTCINLLNVSASTGGMAKRVRTWAVSVRASKTTAILRQHALSRNSRIRFARVLSAMTPTMMDGIASK
jgi:hypothetical protein